MLTSHYNIKLLQFHKFSKKIMLIGPPRIPAHQAFAQIPALSVPSEAKAHQRIQKLNQNKNLFRIKYFSNLK